MFSGKTGGVFLFLSRWNYIPFLIFPCSLKLSVPQRAQAASSDFPISTQHLRSCWVPSGSTLGMRLSQETKHLETRGNAVDKPEARAGLELYVQMQIYVIKKLLFGWSVCLWCVVFLIKDPGPYRCPSTLLLFPGHQVFQLLVRKTGVFALNFFP